MKYLQPEATNSSYAATETPHFSLAENNTLLKTSKLRSWLLHESRSRSSSTSSRPHQCSPFQASNMNQMENNTLIIKWCSKLNHHQLRVILMPCVCFGWVRKQIESEDVVAPRLKMIARSSTICECLKRWLESLLWMKMKSGSEFSEPLGRVMKKRRIPWIVVQEGEENETERMKNHRI